MTQLLFLLNCMLTIYCSKHWWARLQCHCYVCDSLAPCAQWGEGNNSNDHCHASEEPRWKILRKVAKCGTVPSPVPPASGASAQAAATLSSEPRHMCICLLPCSYFSLEGVLVFFESIIFVPMSLSALGCIFFHFIWII